MRIIYRYKQNLMYDISLKSGFANLQRFKSYKRKSKAGYQSDDKYFLWRRELNYYFLMIFTRREKALSK